MRSLHKFFHSSTDASELAHLVAQMVRRDLRFIALDVETANGSMASICQIGLACTARDGSMEMVDLLVKPQGSFSAFNSQLHGIDAHSVRFAPDFAQAVTPLRPLLEAFPLIQHSGFDRRAMNAACDAYHLPHMTSIWHDSVRIARRAWPQLKGNGGHGLASLKEFLNLEFQHHDAAEDARAAAMVVLAAEDTTGHSFDLLTAPTTPRQSGGPKTPRRSVARGGNPDGPLFGHTLCLTGKMRVSRAVAADMAAQLGLRVIPRVEPGLTLLAVGGEAPPLDLTLAEGAERRKSSKLRQVDALIAQGHDIQVLDEASFFALLEAAQQG